MSVSNNVAKRQLTYYDILGVGTDASQKELKEAFFGRFYELNKMYYGDNDSCVMDCYYYTSTPNKEADYVAKLLKRAYTVLSDPAKRSQYDRVMADGHRSNVFTTVSGVATLAASPDGLLSMPTLLSLLQPLMLWAERNDAPTAEISRRAAKDVSGGKLSDTLRTENHNGASCLPSEVPKPKHYYMETRDANGNVEVVEYYEFSGTKLPGRVQVLQEQLFPCA